MVEHEYLTFKDDGIENTGCSGKVSSLEAGKSYKVKKQILGEYENKYMLVGVGGTFRASLFVESENEIFNFMQFAVGKVVPEVGTKYGCRVFEKDGGVWKLKYTMIIPSEVTKEGINVYKVKTGLEEDIYMIQVET